MADAADIDLAHPAHAATRELRAMNDPGRDLRGGR